MSWLAMPMPQICSGLPAVGLGVRARRLAGRDAPQLLLAVGVVVAVVRHAQVAVARVAPVAEQHRQRAVARARARSGRRSGAGRVGPHEPAVVAAILAGHEVAAEREGRQRVRALPRRAEGRRPAGAARRSRAARSAVLEAAAAEAAQHDVAAAPQHDQVDVAVAVDVERIGTGDRGQVGDRRRRPARSAARRRPGCRCGTAPPARSRRRRTGRRARRRRSRRPPRRRRRSTRTRRRSGGRCRTPACRRRSAGRRRRRVAAAARRQQSRAPSRRRAAAERPASGSPARATSAGAGRLVGHSGAD